MLRVAEHYSASDTGRQRRANEDSLLARSPLFVVADGMGGAQAGEVASRVAIESFERGLPEGGPPEQALAALVQDANARIHELSHANAEQAGMGTTLTAIWIGAQDVSIAHVGDSRAYCLRGGRLLRLTDDHSLVDELMRQGRLTPAEALEHPQRSVITRALGVEGEVDVDTRTLRGLHGDVFLVCSDGLTTMISEQQIAALLLANPVLRDAGEALIAAANDAGGRDNITVLLVRLEELDASALDGGNGEAPTGTMAALDGASETAARASSGAGGADVAPGHPAVAPSGMPVQPEPEPPPTQAPFEPEPPPTQAPFEPEPPPTQAPSEPGPLGTPAPSAQPGPDSPGMPVQPEPEPPPTQAPFEPEPLGTQAQFVRPDAASSAPVRQRVPRRPGASGTRAGDERRRRLRRRIATRVLVLLVVLGMLGAGGVLFLQSVYFIGTNGRGLVTLYQGVPVQLPGNLDLYSSQYVSGVSASTIPPARRHTLLDHSLRPEGEAASLIRSLELGQLE